MNYEELSDNDVNQVVTSIVYDCEDWCLTSCGMYFYHCGVDGCGFYEKKVVDYCGNVADAWTITSTCGIDINLSGTGVWVASHDNVADVYHSNPLRAAMIVFLKIQEAL